MSRDMSCVSVEKSSENIIRSLLMELPKIADPKIRRGIQLRILSEIAHSERQIRKANRQKDELKNQTKHIIQNARPTLLPRRELRKLTSRIKLLDRKLFAHGRRIDILRLLGTSLAYSFLDRTTILNLGANPPPRSYLIDKEGLSTEIKAFNQLSSSNGSVVILNDITNCLTIGDITRVQNDQLELYEVKSSSTDRPVLKTRQINRMKTATDFLNKQIESGPGYQKRILDVESEETHNWKYLLEVLADAKTDGFSYKIVEGCLAYIAYRTDSVDLEEAVERAELPWSKASSALLVGSLGRHIEGLNVRPLTLFPLEVGTTLDILFGRIKFITLLNLVPFAELFKKRGFEVRFGRPSPSIVERLGSLGGEHLENIDYKVQIFGKSGTPYIVEEGPLLRLVYECLSVNTVIQDLVCAIGKMDEQQ